MPSYHEKTPVKPPETQEKTIDERPLVGLHVLRNARDGHPAYMQSGWRVVGRRVVNGVEYTKVERPTGAKNEKGVPLADSKELASDRLYEQHFAEVERLRADAEKALGEGAVEVVEIADVGGLAPELESAAGPVESDLDAASDEVVSEMPPVDDHEQEMDVAEQVQIIEQHLAGALSEVDGLKSVIDANRLPSEENELAQRQEHFLDYISDLRKSAYNRNRFEPEEYANLMREIAAIRGDIQQQAATHQSMWRGVQGLKSGVEEAYGAYARINVNGAVQDKLLSMRRIDSTASATVDVMNQLRHQTQDIDVRLGQLSARAREAIDDRYGYEMHKGLIVQQLDEMIHFLQRKESHDKRIILAINDLSHAKDMMT